MGTIELVNKLGHETCETRHLKTRYVERIMEAALRVASKMRGWRFIYSRIKSNEYQTFECNAK